MKNDMEKYLASTPIIDHSDPTIVRTAGELTENQKQDADKAISLFYYVRDRIKYNLVSLNETPEDFRAAMILERKEGNCIQKAILLAALARSVHIPARLRFANFKNFKMPGRVVRILGSNLAVFHGYTELYISECWVKATSAFDMETCRDHCLPAVEFDGRNDAKFQPYDLDGSRFAEYVTEYGQYADLPFEQMTRAWTQNYGKPWRQIFAELRRTL